MNHTPNDKERTTASEHLDSIEAVCAEYPDHPWISVSLLLAIVSRETWWGWAPGYRPKGSPAGKGDGGHGHGFFQIDDRSHGVFLRTGQWKEFEAAARYAIEKVLLANFNYLRPKFPGLSDSDISRAAIAAYNCGAGHVRKALNSGGMATVDSRTAGHDYSGDVLELEAWWSDWFMENYR